MSKAGNGGTGYSPISLRPQDPNPLFQFVERETVVKGQNGMERQRELDGTPHTRGGRTALRPPDLAPFIREELTKGSLVEQYAPATKQLPKMDPNETLGVLKSYFEKPAKDNTESRAQVSKMTKAINSLLAIVMKK